MAMDIFYIEFLNVPPSESSKFDVDGLSDNFLKPSLVLIKKKKKNLAPSFDLSTEV